MAKYFDIQNLRMGLFIANTQAVGWITTGITFFSCYLFFISNDCKYAKNFPVSSWDLFVDDLATDGMHTDFAEKICPDRPLILLSFPFNATNKDKPSTNREKLACNNKKSKLEDKPSVNRKRSAGNNKESKPEDKSITNREKLANNHSENANNKPCADIKSLVEKKNINQNSDANI